MRYVLSACLLICALLATNTGRDWLAPRQSVSPIRARIDAAGTLALTCVAKVQEPAPVKPEAPAEPPKQDEPKEAEEERPHRNPSETIPAITGAPGALSSLVRAAMETVIGDQVKGAIGGKIETAGIVLVSCATLFCAYLDWRFRRIEKLSRGAA